MCGTQVPSLVSDYWGGGAEDVPMHHFWYSGISVRAGFLIFLLELGISARWTLEIAGSAPPCQSAVAEGWSSSRVSVSCVCLHCAAFPLIAEQAALPDISCCGLAFPFPSAIVWAPTSAPFSGACSQVVILGLILLAFHAFSYNKSGASPAVSAEQLSPGAGPAL